MLSKKRWLLFLVTCACIVVIAALTGADGGERTTASTTHRFERAVSLAVDEWYRQQKLPPPHLDAALVTAARSNSARAADGAVNPADLRFHLRQSGRMDSGVWPFVTVQASTAQAMAAASEFLERVRREARVASHIGVGAHALGEGATTHTVVTVLLVHRVVTLAPTPPHARPISDRPLTVQGELSSGYRDPSVLYTAPNGAVGEAQLWVIDRRVFSAALPLDQRGPYRVEVLAQGSGGPTVAALFTIYSGVAAPALPVHKLVPPLPIADSPEHGRSIALQLVNEARFRHGLDPLNLHGGLSEVASAHAHDMLDRGYFGHLGPSGEDATDRIARAGIPAIRVLENVSVAANLGTAHAELMDSPGHRRNILDRDVTHVGIGLARGLAAEREVVYLTQKFARFDSPSGGKSARSRSDTGADKEHNSRQRTTRP